MERALVELGHTAARFQLFGSKWDRRILHYGPRWLHRLRTRTELPALVSQVRAWQPDVIFCWRPDTLHETDVHRLRRRCRAPVVYYHNDNPLALRWHRQLLSTVRAYDFCFGYRPTDLDLYRRHGARRFALLMPYSLPWSHYPPSASQPESYAVTFVGHFEDDGRQHAVAALRSAGIDVRIWGRGWESAAIPGLSGPFERISSDRYRDVVWGSAVVLSFLSRRNHDVYTRRSFELPAMGACVLSQRTDELCTLFPEGSSASYFDSPRECAEAATSLLADRVTRQ